MKYKGFEINRTYGISSLNGMEKRRWYVFKKEYPSVWFETLKQAKTWVNKQILKKVV